MAAMTDKSSYDESGTKSGEGTAPRSAPFILSRSMTAGEDPVSSRIILIGIALIWIAAQVLVVVAHDFWISRGGDDNCAVPGPVAVTGKGRMFGGPVTPKARRL
jgi:hypothetical protein